MLSTDVLARSPLLANLPHESLLHLAGTARRRAFISVTTFPGP